MTLLDTLLTPGALTPLVQPIVRVRGRDVERYAYECLTRGPAGTNLERASVDPRRVILEIVEHSSNCRTLPMLAAIAQLRRAGVRFALDDVGHGQSNYRMILDVQPEYFKLDRYFVAGCHGDARRMAVIASLVQLAGDLGGAVVGEGIDDEDDLAPLAGRGVELFQGFLFGEPSLAAEAPELRSRAAARS